MSRGEQIAQWLKDFAKDNGIEEFVFVSSSVKLNESHIIHADLNGQPSANMGAIRRFAELVARAVAKAKTIQNN